MPSRSSGLSRPKSALFESAEGSMHRITTFFSASDTKLHLQRNAPPTPPLAPDPTYASLGGRPRDPHKLSLAALSGDVQDGPPPPDFGVKPSLTPASGNSPFLQPLPPSPIVVPFSRPGTSSGFSTTSNCSRHLSTPSPVELPRLRKKRSGRFGKRDSEATQIAWLLETASATLLEPYDINPLAKGEPVKDLWLESGDTLVYLTAQDSTNYKYKDPVFRIHSSSLMFHALGAHIVDNTADINPAENQQRASQFSPTDLFLDVPEFTDSLRLVVEADTNLQGSANGIARNKAARDSYTSAISKVLDDRIANGTHSLMEHQQAEVEYDDPNEQRIMYKIYYPVIEDKNPSRPTSPNKRITKKPKSSMTDAGDRLQRLIDARNLFAFLERAHLVASKKMSLPFDIFSRIFVQLNLSESDDSTISLAEGHLQTYIDELNLDDVRKDDDAIVEALVMGEMWHSVRLYHEAYIHATGRWEVIEEHPGLGMVSNTTRSRLDRAHINLHQIRLINITNRIPNFDFPSVWVGEGRYPEYKGWKHGYERMRSLVMNHMKHVFGSWPPKPGRNGKGGGSTETGGLNRTVLRRLYDDLCAVYDLTVDREWLHGERIHFEATQGSEDGDESGGTKDRSERHRKTMRSIMGEFDKASVPVHPEMPFDLPRVPYRLPRAARKKKVGFLSRFSKNFKAEEINEVLRNSYNPDALQQYSDSHLVQSFMDMEREFGMNKTIEDSIGARRGAWIFMYCLLQSLVLVVVDGQGLRYGEGIEYFLCENVKGISPWEKGANRRQTRMSGMFVSGPGGGLYSASSAVNHDINPDDEIEMTYRRSHCWIVAEEWRLVRADPGKEGFEGDELGAYLHGYLENNPERGGSAISFSEYIPGQQVPQSPKIEPHQEFAAYNDQLSPVVEEIHRLDIDGQCAYFDHGYHPHEYQAAPHERHKSPSPTSHGQGSQRPDRHPCYKDESEYESPRHEGRASPSRIPAPFQPAENPQITLSPLDMQPFDFDIIPLGGRPVSGGTTANQSGHTSPTQSRSTSPTGRPPMHPQSRTRSPATYSPGSGNMRKGSELVSSASSPLRYNPVMRPEGAPSPYSAHISPRENPVLGPQGRTNMLPRNL